MTKTLIYGATKVDESNAAYAPVQSLEQFQWRNRVLVIMADRDNSRAARQENQVLSERDGLAQRDMIALRIRGGDVSALFGAGEALDGEAIRRDLDGEDGEFSAVLIGKDGTVKLRVQEPIGNDELFAIVDAMPLRATEQANSKISS